MKARNTPHEDDSPYKAKLEHGFTHAVKVRVCLLTRNLKPDHTVDYGFRPPSIPECYLSNFAPHTVLQLLA